MQGPTYPRYNIACEGDEPDPSEFFSGPQPQVLKNVTGRIHDLYQRQSKVVGTLPRTRTLRLLDDRIIGKVELLMLDVDNPAIEIFLQIDSQSQRYTIQDLIDTGIDERMSDSFYITLIDPITPRYVALFNPNNAEPVKDRLYWEVTNPTNPPVNITVNSYRYRYWADVELRD